MRSRWSFLTALAAVYLLAAQGFLGTQDFPGAQTLASGAIAGGAVICSAQARRFPAGPPDPFNRQAPPHCCLTGCCMSGPAAALTPAPARVAALRPVEVVALAAAVDECLVPPQRRNPHSPRAPPLKGSRSA